jgi:hypothetical protein
MTFTKKITFLQKIILIYFNLKFFKNKFYKDFYKNLIKSKNIISLHDLKNKLAIKYFFSLSKIIRKKLKIENKKTDNYIKNDINGRYF